MKSAVSSVAVVVLLAGCASSTLSSGPEVQVHLEQVAGPPDVYYFAGPVNIQYRLSITNPTNEPLTLTTWASDEGPKINIPETPAGGRGRGRGRGRGAAGAGGFTPPPPLAITWSMFRGPGAVKFDNRGEAFEVSIKLAN